MTGTDHATSEQEVRERALGLLARREHSALELRRKLCLRQYPVSLVERVLGHLQEEGLLSETRFAEAYVYHRRQRGFGPLRIRAELRERGVEESLVDVVLGDLEEAWGPQLREVYLRKYGGGRCNEIKERARRSRFLQQRGFSPGQIRQLLDECPE